MPLPLATHVLVVCHSGSPHKLESSQYNERRRTCERAAATIATVHPEVRTLRDVDLAMLPEARSLLDETSFRRVRHVVTENARVEATRAALEVGDLAAVGSIWAASHASLRNDFEVSSPELDALVEIASAIAGVAAARMTGGGFGGIHGEPGEARRSLAPAGRYRDGVPGSARASIPRSWRSSRWPGSASCTDGGRMTMSPPARTSCATLASR